MIFTKTNDCQAFFNKNFRYKKQTVGKFCKIFFGRLCGILILKLNLRDVIVTNYFPS